MHESDPPGAAVRRMVRTGLFWSTSTQHSETWLPAFTLVNISGVIYRVNGCSPDLSHWLHSIPSRARIYLNLGACQRSSLSEPLGHCIALEWYFAPIVFPSLSPLFLTQPLGYLTLSSWRTILFTQQKPVVNTAKMLLIEVIAEGSFRKT